MQKTIRNNYYLKGEYQPTFLQGLALGTVIIAAIFAAYLSISKSDDESIQGTEAPIEKIAETSNPEQELNDKTPVVDSYSTIEKTEPAVKKILLSEGQAIKKIPELSPRPLVQNWISTEEYTRKTIALIDNIARNKFPKKDLAQFFLDEKFKVTKDAGNIVLDPTGYERFNKITESIVSIDSALVADIFQALEPKVQSFYDELGNTDKSFRSTFIKAVNNIQKVPVIHDPIILVRPKIYYKFADPELESMSTLNKQFVRMGPVNTLLIQNKLKEITLLIERLPPG